MTYVVDKMIEARLRWFGHLKRKCADALMRRRKMLNTVGTRRARGRSKKYQEKVIN